MFFRIFVNIVIYLVSILFPGWAFFILGVVASYIFANYYEFILIALMVDSLYGFPIPGWYGFRFIFTSLALVVFIVTKFFKSKVRTF